MSNLARTHRKDHLKDGHEVTLWWLDLGPFSLEMVDGAGKATWHQINTDEVGIQHELGLWVVKREHVKHYIGREFDPAEGVAA